MKSDELARRLNQDLAAELASIIQYTTYAAKVTGPHRPELSRFFLDGVTDEQKHAQILAHKIVALGDAPATTAAEVPDARTNREMLEAVLERERDTVARYTERAKEAERFGDKGLAVQLEEIVREETGHTEEAERILTNWPE